MNILNGMIMPLLKINAKFIKALFVQHSVSGHLDIWIIPLNFRACVCGLPAHTDEIPATIVCESQLNSPRKRSITQANVTVQ